MKPAREFIMRRSAENGDAIFQEDSMRHFVLSAFAICAALLMGAQASAQQPAAAPPLPPAFSYGAPITLEQARKVAAAAEAEAKKRNMIMVIAIVEPTGDIVYFM